MDNKDGSLSYGVVEIPGRDQELFVIGSASGRTGTGIEPGQMRIEVYPTGDDRPLGTAVLDQGGSVEVDGLSYSFEREQQFTGMLVKRDPGAGGLVGFLLLVIGTCGTMLFRHHRIWIRVTDSDDGGSLVQLASPDRQDPSFTRQFAEVVPASPIFCPLQKHQQKKGMIPMLEVSPALLVATTVLP